LSAHTTVTGVRERSGGGFHVTTDQGSWDAPTVVLATGACARPIIPAAASGLPDHVHQLAPNSYRNPDQLPDGGVLVVGASASGLQLAEEIHASGRPVTLAVGSHARMPRTYRGMDIQWWLDAIGTLDLRYDEVSDLDAMRAAPSLQLIGTPEHRTLDLGVLAAQGVQITGRVVDAGPDHVDFSDDLAQTVAEADQRLNRLLNRIDSWVVGSRMGAEILPPTRPLPLKLPDGPTRLQLSGARITTVLWATGYRPHMPWLEVPVFDDGGHLIHDGGITPVGGLYAMGLPFLRRRKSSFIDGFGVDAADLAAHLSRHLHETARQTKGAFHVE
jgi:putative flavoprotein involved in K+ transport